MRPTDNIRKSFRKLHIPTSSELDEKILDEITRAIGQTNENIPAKPVSWRIIMKSKITKYAAAAVIIIGVLIGIHYSGGSIDGSGVVWAEVLKQMENSQGLIYQRTTSDQANVYSIVYMTPKYTRTNSYLDAKIDNTPYANYESYSNYETMIHTIVWPEAKLYRTNTINTNSIGFFGTNEDQINPMNMLERILSYRHNKLGPQIIEGVLCEGIETTDPDFCFESLSEEEADKIESLEIHMQLWINTKTRYPVMAKWEGHVMAEGEVIDASVVLNQFQWNVDLDPSIFEPNIPPDYTDIRSR